MVSNLPAFESGSMFPAVYTCLGHLVLFSYCTNFTPHHRQHIIVCLIFCLMHLCPRFHNLEYFLVLFPTSLLFLTPVFFVFLAQVDILINLLTGVEYDVGDVDYSVISILQHYLKLWIWVDLLGNLPLECILVAAYPNTNFYNLGTLIRYAVLPICWIRVCMGFTVENDRNPKLYVSQTLLRGWGVEKPRVENCFTAELPGFTG